jgi:splicing factor 3B subunit 3
LTRSGLLYTASEFGAQYFFQIQGLGDDDDTAETCASVPLDAPLYFDPRPLKNLALLDELDSLAPLLDVKAADLCQDDTMQIFAACGRGARSSLKILRQGLQVSEQAVTQLATQPTAVWSVKRHRSDPFDSYIVVSFINSTIVLSIGETVEEVSDSGFIDQTQTLHCALLGDDSLLQVHPDGIRHIRADRRVNEWKPSGSYSMSCFLLHLVPALTFGAPFESLRQEESVARRFERAPSDRCSHGRRFDVL